MQSRHGRTCQLDDAKRPISCVVLGAHPSVHSALIFYAIIRCPASYFGHESDRVNADGRA